MDSALRQPLTPPPRGARLALAVGALAVAAPALWGLLLMWAPLALGMGPLWADPSGATSGAWHSLWHHPQTAQALMHTLVSATLGTLGAVAIGWGALRLAWGRPAWRHWTRPLPAWLALPHVAFAAGLVWLIAPTGWLARLGAGWLWPADAPPDWWWPQDPHALSLALGLALKEAVFFVWMAHAHLSHPRTLAQWRTAQSLGLDGAPLWRWVLGPPLWHALRASLLAMWAYGLSVVDVAALLGPTTPPTLAVLAHQWLMDPPGDAPHIGAAATAVLTGLVLLGAGLGHAVLRRWTRPRGVPTGQPRGASPRVQAAAQGLGLGLWWAGGLLIVGVLVVAAGAQRWFYPDVWPAQWAPGPGLGHDRPLVDAALADAAGHTVTLSLASATLGTALAWLTLIASAGRSPSRESPPLAHAAAWAVGPPLVYGVLMWPALPLAAGQHLFWAQWGWDGRGWAVVLAHTLWVWPYALLVLAAPYAQLPRGLSLTAQALGMGPWRTQLRIVGPLLARHLTLAWAVGVSVSVAQYLPTLHSGAGRWPTLTTEAVAASAGGHPQAMASAALLQALWPAAVFAAVSLLWAWGRRHRQGWM